MLATSVLYRAAARAADVLLPLVRGISPKLRAGDLARRGAVGRWVAWSQSHRDRERPLLWIHAPSVGEGLQAEAVLTLLRQRNPDWQIVYSFFSPSAAGLAGRLPADYADYLPYDTRSNVDTVLGALEPTALVFTKLDVWPELATRAKGRGVRVGLIAGTVSPVSGRRRPLARALTRPAYAAIDRVGAIAAADAERLIDLGAAASRVAVTGDPRFDSVATKLAALPYDWPLARLTGGAATLVAGSTWDGDQEILLQAWQTVHPRFPDARLLVVPHEPTATNLARLSALIAATGQPVRLLSDLPDGEPVPPLLVVDRVGVLAGLYRGAAIAYVGGGYGRAGLHSVLEPAACGVPVVFGPRWQASREAGLLIDVHAATALPTSSTEAAPRLAAIWSEWLTDTSARETAGRAALKLVRQGQGAAVRSAELVEALMQRPRSAGQT